MKLQIARFRTSVHFGKGIHTDAVMVGNPAPSHRWVQSIDADEGRRWVYVTTNLEGMHQCVMVPMENVTCFVPLREAQPANGKAQSAAK